MIRLHSQCMALCGLILAVGLCHAQAAPQLPYLDVQIVGEPMITGSPDHPIPIAHSEYAAADSHRVDAEGHGDHVTADHDHGVHAFLSDSFESPELISECRCGKKHCHGVCRDPGHPKKPRITKPGDRDWGDCPPKRYCMNQCKRAGNPHRVAAWARCSADGKYSAWYVGGGAAFFRGRCRTAQEGTWGLDYDGCFGCINNWLKYTRCRNQGGEGAYKTDGEPECVSRVCELLPFGH